MIGQQIHDFAKSLWSINRSLTGHGVRETLKEIQELLPPMVIKELPSGTEVFDWKVPNEWDVEEAYILTPGGEKICEFSKNNLHLVGYSIPFRGILSLEELQDHLYSLPDQPNAIPYVTSYYKERWGFCLSENDRQKLVGGDYEVVIKSRLFPGVMNYGELFIQGRSQQEVFLSTYICHPSMANNELSGPTVTTYLAKWLLEAENLSYSYRIVFLPETIGSISYLSQNLDELKANVFSGFNITCIGDNRAYSYLPSRNGETISDSIAKHVLRNIDADFISYTWLDRGSDERQYCSPGIDLPMASIMRSKYGEYPEYHTSLDNLQEVVTPDGLDGGYWAVRRALELIEKNAYYRVNVFAEPQMGKRGLYPTVSTGNIAEQVRRMMNFISYCDGQCSLLEIADLIGVAAWELYDIVERLESEGVITKTAEV